MYLLSFGVKGFTKQYAKQANNKKFALYAMRTAEDTAKIRFSAVRSPQFWVSAVTAQNDESNGSFHSSYSRSLNIETWQRNSTLSLDTSRYVP